ncbi:L,D-transpeptidase family protein [Flavisphingomonas formosensis]|uniref:L,D-transpeptidase family protein n=1 Tax=Flavisphingomonas formosensis TaxID=861534 RepID=UPI001E33274A|nr:L,D-transpeptidase family protein [Sphingomonas formosensis]
MIRVPRRPALAVLTAPVLLAAAQPQAVPTIQSPPPPPSVVAPPPVVAPPRAMPRLTDAQLGELRAILDTADANGIAPSDATSAAPTSQDATTLINAALDYAKAVHHGRLAPEEFMKDWGLRPAEYDPWPGFLDAVQKNRLTAWFNSLPPPYAGYDTLKKALARYREIEKAGGWDTLSEGTDLVPGASGDRVAALRTRLAIEDSALPEGPAKYDADVTAAVQRAQRRYGLEPTGSVGKATLAALNVPAHDRVRQIEANMERWRWLPAELPQHRIQVNIAAAVLTVFDADKPVLSMRAVTGRPGDETPMLSSMIHSIVFNPPWNVPTSIAKRELWPKGAAYLKSHGYRVIGSGPTARLQQAAGPKSALGRVKFDFDNPYGVYLHDTPSQGTFDRYSRLASHGCVRLAHPVDLAKLTLQGSTDWTPDAVDAALAKGSTVRAPLPERIAVFLFYWTAYASADGRVSFLADPYSWDSALADRLKTSADRAKQQMAAR